LPHIELVPDQARQSHTRQRAIAILPPSVRRFGFVPDIEQLLPGDLILSRTTSPGWIDNQIAKSQGSGGFAAENARWTHAAVFIGDDQLVEALPLQGVVQHSIYSYIPSEIIRVRRRPGLSDAQRHRIAIHAMTSLRTRYSVFSAVKLGMDLSRGLWNSNALRTNRYIVICSQLYFDSILEILKIRLDGCPTEAPTTPAHLGATADLTDVSVDWLQVSP
jgi:hypothetical protein